MMTAFRRFSSSCRGNIAGQAAQRQAEALDWVRAVVYHIATEGHGITLRFRRKHRFQGGQVPVDVRDNEKFHGVPYY